MPSTILDSAVFRDIYTTPAMRAVWSDENRIGQYLAFEAALAKVEAALGIVPKDAAAEIVKQCDLKIIDMAKLKDATEAAGSPIIPVVKQIMAACKDKHGEWVHWGATTQDVTDTGMVLQVQQALDLLEADLDGICDGLAALATKYRDTPMAGRSKLQQAVPVTFGYKMAAVLSAFQRHKERLAELRARVLVGSFGGAAGTLSSLGADGLKVHDALMDELKLGKSDISWHTVRDRFGETASFLGLVTATCAKIALDVKLLMQTEVQEVSEASKEGRGSSSTMPQKRNPISSVYITTQAAVVRHLVGAMLEAQVEDHERGSGPWEIEWVVLPDMFMLSAAVLGHARELVEGLQVNATKMRENLDITNGLIMSEAVTMGLGKTMGRDTAHHLVSKLGKEAMTVNRPLIELLAADKEIAKHADRKQLEALMDPANYLGVAGAMVDRVLAKHGKR
jgi:3-carboxy-cis,cis-muconate cycloisomerase